MLIMAAWLFIIGASFGALSHSVMELVLARLLLGLAIGVSSYTAPLYISEISPANYRGRLVLLNGIAITGGEALAFLLDYYLSFSSNWRMMIFIGIIPAIVLLLGMFSMPCSPRWLVSKGRMKSAKDVLQKVRCCTEINVELSEIERSLEKPKSSLKTLFAKKRRRVLTIGIGLGILQQIVGINTVMYYGPFIFKAAGFQGEASQILATFGMGITNMLMTVVAVCLVDYFGRRRLLISGIIIAMVSLAIVGANFKFHLNSNTSHLITLIALMTYIAGYSISLGSMFWLIISEIYPLHIRSVAMSFVTAIQWGANFIVAATFLSLLETVGITNLFWLYGIVCVAAIFFCYYLIPETKGVSLEQMEEMFQT